MRRVISIFWRTPGWYERIKMELIELCGDSIVRLMKDSIHLANIDIYFIKAEMCKGRRCNEMYMEESIPADYVSQVMLPCGFRLSFPIVIDSGRDVFFGGGRYWMDEHIKVGRVDGLLVLKYDDDVDVSTLIAVGEHIGKMGVKCIALPKSVDVEVRDEDK